MKANLTIAFALALLTLCLAGAMRTKGVSGAVEPESEYLSPGEMAFSPDGRSLYIVCERSNELLVVDAATNKITARIPVGRLPRNLALSPDGKQIFVANSWEDTVSVIDVAT